MAREHAAQLCFRDGLIARPGACSMHLHTAFEQAENRLHSIQAILVATLGN